MSDGDLFELRRQLFESRSIGAKLVDRLRKANRNLQHQKTEWARAKANAYAEITAKTGIGQRLELEQAMLEHDAVLENAELELKLAILEHDTWKTLVSALQSEIKTHEVEARFST